MRIRDALVAAGIAAILAGCAQAPGDTIISLQTSIAKKDFDAAMKTIAIDKAATRGVSQDKLEALLAEKAQRYAGQACGGLKEVKVLSEQINGDASVVEYELICANGSTMKMKDDLLKTKDGWKVVIA